MGPTVEPVGPHVPGNILCARALVGDDSHPLIMRVVADGQLVAILQPVTVTKTLTSSVPADDHTIVWYDLDFSAVSTVEAWVEKLCVAADDDHLCSLTKPTQVQVDNILHIRRPCRMRMFD